MSHAVFRSLESLGFGVDLFDLDKQPAQTLFSYDCVELIGGNPYTLLEALREKPGPAGAANLSPGDKLLIGWERGGDGLGTHDRPDRSICT